MAQLGLITPSFSVQYTVSDVIWEGERKQGVFFNVFIQKVLNYSEILYISSERSPTCSTLSACADVLLLIKIILGLGEKLGLFE